MNDKIKISQKTNYHIYVLLKNECDNIIKNKDDETEERDFTFDERLRVQHLDRKSEGLRNKTYENVKEELYNAKDLLVNN